MVIFLYNLYTNVWIQQGHLTNLDFALDSSNSVIKRLWCILFLITSQSGSLDQTALQRAKIYVFVLQVMFLTL